MRFHLAFELEVVIHGTWLDLEEGDGVDDALGHLGRVELAAVDVDGTSATQTGVDEGRGGETHAEEPGGKIGQLHLCVS